MHERLIPTKVKHQIDKRIEKFNRTVINEANVYYLPQYSGRFLYLQRVNYSRSSPICRLSYTGDIDNWEFAIYKYSKNYYDPDEWSFPGANEVDGTIEGAMLAGLAAYPI